MTEFDPIAVRKAQHDSIARKRHLNETVRATRLIGVLFAGIGGLVMIVIMASNRRTPTLILAALSTLLIAPGVLYVLAGIFLKRRRYWAWKTTVVMTILLLVTVVVLCVALIVAMIRSNVAEVAWLPAVSFICWAISLASILFSLRQCLPAILETEQNAQKGFAVIPVANLAPTANELIKPD